MHEKKEDKTNTPDELLDLVDENDQIIGEVLKGEANENPKLIHREVAILIYDDKDRILFQQRSKNKKVHPEMWGLSAAGHVPKGMDLIEAAHMELQEELGFDTKLRLIDKRLTKMPNETRFTYFYIGKYPGAKIVIEPQEVEQAKFFSKEELGKFIKSGGNVGGLSLEYAGKYWNGKFLVGEG